MVFKLYGLGSSPAIQRVATILIEMNVVYELIPIDLATREQKSPLYLEKQPFGQVPYMDDAGFILYERRAICYYIARKYANKETPSLIPLTSDVQATSLFQQALSVEICNFDEFASKAVHEKVFKPQIHKVPTDEKIYNDLISKLDQKLEGYERILTKQRYLAGDEMTLADLHHLPYGQLLNSMGCEVLKNSKRINVARWWNDISTRPSWQAVKDGTKSTA